MQPHVLHLQPHACASRCLAILRWLHIAPTCLSCQALRCCLQMAAQNPLAEVKEKIQELEKEIKEAKTETTNLKEGRSKDA